MEKLLKGILDFRAKRSAGYDLLFKTLAEGQSPDALFITCSDSRVVPNLLASTDPGDLFVMRNVGNVVPPCCEQSGRSQTDDSEIAALEYALLYLNVKDIIVCGHSNCGAIQAICTSQNTDQAHHLKNWLTHAQQALEQFDHELLFEKTWPEHDQVSQKNVLVQMKHLESYDLVRRAIAEQGVRIHGWWFDIEAVVLYAYNRAENKFKMIDEAEAAAISAGVVAPA